MSTQSTRLFYPILIGAFLLVASFSVPVRGDVLSPASGYVTAEAGQNGVVGSGPLPEGAVDGDSFGDLASGSVVGSPFPFALAQAVSDGGGAFATSDLFYQFEVAGPSNLNVPLLVSGDLWAGISNSLLGDSEAYAIVDIVSSVGIINNFHPLDESAYALGTDAPIHSLVNSYDDFNDAITVTSGVPYNVSVSAGTDLGGGNTTAGATADPYIQIAPSFAALNPGFSLEFSAGIDNSPIATPEPSSLAPCALIVTGLAVLRVRRRKRASYCAALLSGKDRC